MNYYTKKIFKIKDFFCPEWALSYQVDDNAHSIFYKGGTYKKVNNSSQKRKMSQKNTYATNYNSKWLAIDQT